MDEIWKVMCAACVADGVEESVYCTVQTAAGAVFEEIFRSGYGHIIGQ